MYHPQLIYLTSPPLVKLLSVTLLVLLPMLISLLLLAQMYHRLLPDNATPVKTISKLNFFYTNADQFLNKRDDLLMLIASDEPDILILTEVIPKAQLQSNPISFSRLTLPGYFIHVNFDLIKLIWAHPTCRAFVYILLTT